MYRERERERERERFERSHRLISSDAFHVPPRMAAAIAGQRGMLSYAEQSLSRCLCNDASGARESERKQYCQYMYIYIYIYYTHIYIYIYREREREREPERAPDPGPEELRFE